MNAFPADFNFETINKQCKQHLVEETAKLRKHVYDCIVNKKGNITFPIYVDVGIGVSQKAIDIVENELQDRFRVTFKIEKTGVNEETPYFVILNSSF